MEGTQEAQRRPGLGRSAPSFRLRSPSLNTLRLRRVFDLFDHNKDGEITVAELYQALVRLGLEVDAVGVGSTVAAFIRPGHAGLEFEDFEGLHGALGDALFGNVAEGAGETEAEAAESDLVEAFSVFDEDGDGFISAAELQAVLRKLGLPQAGNIADIRQMICTVDSNHDGQVDFCEFKHMMQGISVWGA
ncbi:hypothetical protein Taro_012259 [Colocasia esculenta]|uniref:EF-hand domain-containing protein n=1 Tax=Colocasia esculenta TaxID=4460 RepID=A0A843UCC8_COLES|nr:hypothetical protein [Colocasia esculenta]